MLAWPDWEVRLLEEYLAKQPAAGDRIEIALARLTAFYCNAHQREGATPRETLEFLAYHDPWPVPIDVGSGRYSALDLEVMKGLK